MAKVSIIGSDLQHCLLIDSFNLNLSFYSETETKSIEVLFKQNSSGLDSMFSDKALNPLNTAVLSKRILKDDSPSPHFSLVKSICVSTYKRCELHRLYRRSLKLTSTQCCRNLDAFVSVKVQCSIKSSNFSKNPSTDVDNFRQNQRLSYTAAVDARVFLVVF